MTLESFPLSPPDSDEPGIPVAGFRFSNYPKDQVKMGMGVTIRHLPQPSHPHACGFFDAKGMRLGWVPDGLAQVMWEVVADPETRSDLIVSYVEDHGPLGLDIWVNGLLYLPAGSVT